MMGYLVAYFITRAAMTIYHDLPKQVSSAEACKKQLKDMNTWSHAEFGCFEYCAVQTSEGNGVYHLLVHGVSVGRNYSFGGFVGYKAFWFWCSENWFNLHYSPVVWTKLVRGVKKIVNYIISQYIAGQDCLLRYHWSWRWVFRGFLLRWRRLCRAFSFNIKVILPKWRSIIYRSYLDEISKQCVLDGG